MMLLDGSMGTLLCDLASRSFPDEIDTIAQAKLWSSYFNISHKDTVKLAHIEYLAAGSDLILTNTYQASLRGYMECFPERSKDEACYFVRDGVRIALEAIKCFEPKLKPLVVSFGPYGAYLCNGQEYSGDYGNVSDYDLIEFHLQRLDAILNEEFLQHAQAKKSIRSILFETLPNITEIKIILEAVKRYTEMLERFDIKVWLSLSVKVKEDVVTLADGTRVECVVKLLEAYSEELKLVTTLGVNCLAPEDSPFAVKKLKNLITLKDLDKLKILCKPNRGDTWDATLKRWVPQDNSSDFLQSLQDCIKSGAHYIGGCCQTTPDDIKQLKELMISINPAEMKHDKLLLVFLLTMAQLINVSICMSKSHRNTLKATVKEMFYHAYDNYMKHAFPMDELNPVRCSGKGRDYVNPKNGINDVLGDYCLTLVDSLGTLLVMGDHEEFKRAIALIVKHVNFSRHANRVQVFETSIRILGGLLSGHLLAADVKLHRHLNFSMEGHYNGELLALAHDLGKRLLPAFEESKTDLPYARVNLVYGIDKEEISETCTAGAGTLLLEFGLLSRLTGDQRFEELARKSIESIWAKRSSLNLVGNTLDVNSGEWIHKDSGINAGIDSFYEYLLKAYVVFGDKYYLEMFEESYKAVLTHVRDPEGYMYRPVHMDTGQPFATWIDSLSAFFPGLQVMYGDLPNAIRLHEVYFSIWKKYNALPERFDFIQKNVNLPYYPLRPELIESTYFLYQATSADYYLEAGATFLKDLQKYTKTKCGYASIKHVVTKSMDDRMESFFLSETLKYLYLLFDSENYFNKENVVFTTEAHILYVDKDILKLPQTIISWDTTRRKTAKERLKDQLNLKKNSLVCKKPKVKPYIAPTPLLEPKEVDYVNFLTGLDYSKPAEAVGMCLNTGRNDKMKLADDITHVFFDYKEMFSSNEDSDSANQAHKSASIQWLENGDILLDTVNQLNMALNSVGDGIAISQINNFKVNPNRRIFVSQNGLKSLNKDQPFFPEFEVAMLRVFRPQYLNVYPGFEDVHLAKLETQVPLFINPEFSKVKKRFRFFEDLGIIPAAFGPRLNLSSNDGSPGYPLEKGVVYLPHNPLFCNSLSFKDSLIVRDDIVLIRRGECMFYEKVLHAQNAGAAAVIIMNTNDDMLQMSPVENSKDDITIPSFLMSATNSKKLLKMLNPDFLKDSALDQVSGKGYLKMHFVRAAVIPSSAISDTRIPSEKELAGRNALNFNGQSLKNLYILTQKEYNAFSSSVSIAKGNNSKKNSGTIGGKVEHKKDLSIIAPKPSKLRFKRRVLQPGMRWSCLIKCTQRNYLKCCS